MARKVFFSFHYERDVWRSSIVRNSDTVKAEADERGFIDAVEWEKLKKSGDAAVQKWIKDQMNGTSVTVVLIGAETSTRPWVQYELQQSYARGNAIVGIRIHNIKDNDKKTDTEGKTTFGSLGKNVQGQDVYFGNVATVYDWVNNDGYRNFATWVESAAIAAGK
jgi:hypothetical protein